MLLKQYIVLDLICRYYYTHFFVNYNKYFAYCTTKTNED